MESQIPATNTISIIKMLTALFKIQKKIFKKQFEYKPYRAFINISKGTQIYVPLVVSLSRTFCEFIIVNE